MQKADVTKFINDHPVVIFSKTYCGYSSLAKDLLRRCGAFPKVLELDEIPGGTLVHDLLKDLTTQRTVPYVFIKGRFIGGYDSLENLHHTGELEKSLRTEGTS